MDETKRMTAEEALKAVTGLIDQEGSPIHQEALSVLTAMVEENTALKMALSTKDARIRAEFATAINNAEEMREWKAHAEKAEARVEELTIQIEAARQHTVDVAAELDAAMRRVRALDRAIDETGRGDSLRIQAVREGKGKP